MSIGLFAALPFGIPIVLFAGLGRSSSLSLSPPVLLEPSLLPPLAPSDSARARTARTAFVTLSTCFSTSPRVSTCARPGRARTCLPASRS